MQTTDHIKLTMADVTADRKGQELPGHAFAQAVVRDGLAASVEYDVTITDSITTSRRKRRYPARNMFKIIDLSREPRRYSWRESPARQDSEAITNAKLRPELTNRPSMLPIPELSTTTGWLQIPDGIWEDQEAFASLLNLRLVTRLGTAENHTLIRGETGLLNISGIGRLTSKGPFSSTILAACNEVEQVGSTVDGLVLNPEDYYKFMSEGRLMSDLEQNGVFIVRARLVDPGTAIVGDFGHGAELLDAGRSVIRFADPPPGTFTQPGIAVMAQIYERVVVNLPATFWVVTV
jgi:hypothetical protein